MLDYESIVSWFCVLSGVPADETLLWRAMCLSCASKVEGRLKKDLDMAAAMERICYAAAEMAYARYLSRHQSGAEVRVGDVSVKSASVPRYDDERYLAQISDLLEPEGFAFVQAPEKGAAE